LLRAPLIGRKRNKPDTRRRSWGSDWCE